MTFFVLNGYFFLPFFYECNYLKLIITQRSYNIFMRTQIWSGGNPTKVHENHEKHGCCSQENISGLISKVTLHCPPMPLCKRKQLVLTTYALFQTEKSLASEALSNKFSAPFTSTACKQKRFIQNLCTFLCKRFSDLKAN